MKDPLLSLMLNICTDHAVALGAKRPVNFPSDFNPPAPPPLTEEELAEMELEFRGRELDAELSEKQAMKDEPPQ